MEREIKNRVPASELNSRMARFREIMDKKSPDWEIAVIFNRIHQYYFTGTIQDAVLIIPRDREAGFHVRRSIKRARDESFFPCIYEMYSYRDAAAYYPNHGDTVYLDAESATLALLERFNRHFKFREFKPLDRQLSDLKAVKSPYEIKILEKAGKIHQKVLESDVLDMLQEGMSEAELATRLYAHMINLGHNGVTRFSQLGLDTTVGVIGFGESSIYPTNYDGPDGNIGISIAVPINGSPDVRLKRGQLVFLDVGCCIDGYHTDKTMTYMFGGDLPAEAVSIQRRCEEIMERTAEMLKPGEIPSEIYKKIMKDIDEEFLENFMGLNGRYGSFLGHSIGLFTDEKPIIADGFDEPLKEGMVFAIEPKKGMAGIGMLGIENTFLVTGKGGVSITGNSPGLIRVG